MSNITFKQAKHSYERLSDYLYDEQKDYECTYHVDGDAEDIPTEELNKEHVYTDSRILDDYFNQKQSNYNEKVKDILWEYVSKNDEEEIFKRMKEIRYE
tara:strand:- start:787 stop:1083 length:297 start_codon:yes stop_codon:yes gene_type:complete